MVSLVRPTRANIVSMIDKRLAGVTGTGRSHGILLPVGSIFFLGFCISIPSFMNLIGSFKYDNTIGKSVPTLNQRGRTQSRVHLSPYLEKGGQGTTLNHQGLERRMRRIYILFARRTAQVVLYQPVSHRNIACLRLSTNTDGRGDDRRVPIFDSLWERLRDPSNGHLLVFRRPSSFPWLIGLGIGSINEAVFL